MTLNEYQQRAMRTCMPTCDNISYSVTGLTAEVGEINDKLAKWVRKGIARITDNELVFSNSVSPQERAELIESLCYEISDVQWFVAHIARQLGRDLEEIGQKNLDKLASRAKRGVIDGNGDNR